MDPGSRTARAYMNAEYVSVASTDHLDLVDDVMKLGRIRHMPVIDDGELVGIVSQRDLLAASLSQALEFEARHRRTFMRAIEVSEAMTRKPLTVDPDTQLSDAARLMLEHKVGCLPVVSDGAVIGILTESDLLRALC